MNQTMVCINNREIQPKEWLGQRVVTFQDVEAVHDRPEGTAKRNFRANREHFIPNEDFFEITRDEFRTNFVPNSKPQGNPNLSIILLTEYGYLMLVKSFTDDLAWNIQRELIKSYFRNKQNLALQISDQYPMLDQAVFKLQQSDISTSNKLIEYGYRLLDLEEDLSTLQSRPIDPHKFELVCIAVEINNKRLYKLESARHRQDKLLGMLANDDPIISQTGKALLLPIDEYKAWVKKSVIEISSKRKANTLSVYRELYNRLDTDKSSSEVAKEWRDAIRNDGYITYKTYNELTSRPTKVKLIHDIFDAVCHCGETHTYELKDCFTELVVRELEG